MDRNSDVQPSTSQDLFQEWLFGLPDSVSIERAALTEIARIDGIASPSDEQRSLRGLFHQALLVNALRLSRRRRRQQ